MTDLHAAAIAALKAGKTPRTARAYTIRPIEPEPTPEGEEQSKGMVHGAPLTSEDGEPLTFPTYGEAKAEAESRGYNYRNVTRWTADA